MHSPVPKPALPAVGLFSDLDAAQREAIAGELTTRALKRGDVLVRQGERPTRSISWSPAASPSRSPGGASPSAEVGPGQPIGEIAFLAGGTRTATVTALRDSLVLRLGRAEFESLSAKNPGDLAHADRDAVAARRRGNVSKPPPPDPRPRTITLIRAGASALPRSSSTG